MLAGWLRDPARLHRRRRPPPARPADRPRLRGLRRTTPRRRRQHRSLAHPGQGALGGLALVAFYLALLLISPSGTGLASAKQHIPFGPFMIVGAFLVILL
jgi:hypothetical protein